MVFARIILAVICCGALMLAPSAYAQDNSNSNVFFNAPGLLIKKPKPGLPEVRAQPQAWPRLDPGAVLCRSEDDLDRLSRRRAGDASGGAVDCQVIRTPTAITIVQRNGPGRTEVKVTSADTETGWTDAWLPAKAPASAPRSASIGNR